MLGMGKARQSLSKLHFAQGVYQNEELKLSNFSRYSSDLLCKNSLSKRPIKAQNLSEVLFPHIVLCT